MPQDCLIISRWETIEDWKIWLNSKERAMIQSKIETLTGEKTEYNFYAPMVARTNFVKSTNIQTESFINVRSNIDKDRRVG